MADGSPLSHPQTSSTANSPVTNGSVTNGPTGGCMSRQTRPDARLSQQSEGRGPDTGQWRQLLKALTTIHLEVIARSLGVPVPQVQSSTNRSRSEEEEYREKLIHACVVEGSSRFIPVFADLLSQMSQTSLTQRGQDVNGDNGHHQASQPPTGTVHHDRTSPQNAPYSGIPARNWPPGNARDGTADSDRCSPIENMHLSSSMSSLFRPPGPATRLTTAFSFGEHSNTSTGEDLHRAQSILNRTPRLSASSQSSMLPNNGDTFSDLSPSEADNTRKKIITTELPLTDITTEHNPSTSSRDFNNTSPMFTNGDENASIGAHQADGRARGGVVRDGMESYFRQHRAGTERRQPQTPTGRTEPSGGRHPGHPDAHRTSATLTAHSHPRYSNRFNSRRHGGAGHGGVNGGKESPQQALAELNLQDFSDDERDADDPFLLIGNPSNSFSSTASFDKSEGE